MNDFEKLKKQDNKIPPMNETLQGQAFETAKRKITGICKSLSYPTDLYKSEYTINSINAYLGISESFGRILYSQISNYVFDLEPNDRATFVSNLDKLLQNVMNNPSLSNDIKKAVARIYDHTQLAVYQIENVQNTFAKGTKEVEDKLIDSVKGVEKEYVGILGIFSSVILCRRAFFVCFPFQVFHGCSIEFCNFRQISQVRFITTVFPICYYIGIKPQIVSQFFCCSTLGSNEFDYSF